MLYWRRELWLLLVLAVCLGLGLAVRELRSRFPDLATRLESLDVDRRHTALAGPPKLARTRISPDRPLDLNHATANDLQRLPGIGPTLAGQIARTRERRGGFNAPDDLLSVPGIGPGRLEGIRDLVTVAK